jgi:hypothetical protein
MKWWTALMMVAMAVWGVGCEAPQTTSRTVHPVSRTPPKPIDEVDRLSLWASPPAPINWDNTPGPSGVQFRVFMSRGAETVLVRGTVEFMMFSGHVQPSALDTAQPLETWVYTARDLEECQGRDMMGWGYMVRLGWHAKPTASSLTFTARYTPPVGETIYAMPITVQMPTLVTRGPISSRIGQTPPDSQAEGRMVEGKTISRLPIKVRQERIDPKPPGTQHNLLLLADLRGTGRLNIIVGARQAGVNLYWYENPTWQRHAIAVAPDLGPGGAVVDLIRKGRPDLIAGQEGGAHELYWFEHPDDPAVPWARHLIDNRLEDYHDIVVGDILGDGKQKIVVLSSRSGILAYYDIPQDPLVSPWPKDCYHQVAVGLKGVQGLLVADINADKKLEIVAGTTIFERPAPGDSWKGTSFAEGFGPSRLLAADIDGDGKLEIVLCETERNPGRLVWFKGPSWMPHLLREDLFHVRCLQAADFSGNGRPDILVGEAQAPDHKVARLFAYVSRGRAQPEEVVLAEGESVGESRIGDLDGDGRPDLATVVDVPEGHVDVWFNETPAAPGSPDRKMLPHN